ncbi:PucR family transcriptional regulator [Nonomuraea sp. C10]|uniref:PucR family transcriptional regulator n=1 Tax=Nonomuraea sp. C10 TaxID=2600577 RepID=UPI0011CEC975|nr:PucR family transcriptional regulator [Nonomuraea sp. C10]TXK42105.1 PucR family transcriptional regulator [Nonomuraea sp. C10]
MRIRDLLAVGEPRLRLLTGDPDRAFTSVHITDLPEPGRYLSGGELVLTGLMWRQGPEDSARFVAALVEAGVAGLGAGQAWLGHIPADLVAACERAGLPLLEVPTEVSFRTLAEQAGHRLTGDAREALGRHRRLVAAVAEGADLPELFALTAAELGVTGAVVSAAGEVIVGAPDDPAGLARAYLTATRLPCLAGGHTLFGVGRGHRAGGWMLACDGDLLDRADLGYELAACVALERSRMEEGRRVERRLAGELLAAALAGADAAELNARFRTSGLDIAEPYAVVNAAITHPGPAPVPAWPDAASGPGEPGVVGVARSAGHGAPREHGPGVLGGQVLEELLGREIVAPPGADGAVAVVPLRGGEVADLAARLRAGAAILSALPDARVCLGLSGALTGAAALRGGVEEAGHARRLAEARDGGVVTSDEIYTHALLLATVPGDVRRSFAGRLLAPLLDYDAGHQSELVRTLATFLDCAGSWNACAERMHVHVNTVRYRIKRVEELTGRDLSTMADRVDLFLALRAR